MALGSDKKKKFKDKLRDTYRVLVIDVEDLKEVGNYQLTMGRLYTYIISALLIFSLLLISLIAFTPLKRLMPGYGDIEENHKFLKLRDQLKNLESEFEEQIIYTQGLQNMLSGQNLDQLDLPGSVKKPEQTEEKQIDSPKSVVVSEVEVAESKITKPLANQYFVSPVVGTISAPFNRSEKHFGTDILAPTGTAIKSVSGGVVISSDFNLDTGNTIAIQHPNNLVSVYKHNSALLKNIGEKVSAGEAIAIIGNTGELTDGPHLHFELWYNGNAINPENFISFK